MTRNEAPEGHLRNLADEFRYRAERWAEESSRPIILERSALLQHPDEFAAGCRKAYAEAAHEVERLLHQMTNEGGTMYEPTSNADGKVVPVIGAICRHQDGTVEVRGGESHPRGHGWHRQWSAKLTPEGAEKLARDILVHKNP